MVSTALDDATRLALLRALDLLRPHADPSFDRVTRAAARATRCPTSLITFLGPEGQWVASSVGWTQPFHPLAESFCLQTLIDDGPVEVCDATSDNRFSSNALVTGTPGVRFYAGHPLKFDGHVLGAVCVLDTVPRRLTSEEHAQLKDLAELVCDLLRVRLERTRAQQERSRSSALLDALRKSEVTSRESEERYRLLWQTTTDAVLIIDEGNFIQFANPALEKVFGRSPSEAVGQHLSTLIPERLRDAHAEGFRRYIQSGQRRLNWRGTQATGLRADGSEIPIELAFSEMAVGDRRLFAAFIRDVSERHRAQSALLRSEAQFRALTALSADWYWEVDTEFRYTYLSDGAQRSGLLDPVQAIGKRPWEVRPNADDAAWQRQKARVALREAFRDFEMLHTAPDGVVHTLQISGEPIFDADHNFAGYRGVGRNVTEERRAHRIRKEIEDHLRESQKLEAIGVLAGGIAHDFNNVIAGILGNVKLALDDLESGHPAAGSLHQIRKAGQRGREMVQQILTFASRRPKRSTGCDLRDLVDETMGLLKATVPPSVKLAALLPSIPLRIVADPTQVEQALINLCANAWQAMQGRPGHIEISAETVELGDDSVGNTASLPRGSYVHLLVSDDGPGMDDAIAKRIFEPFFTTKPEGEGTGLGLSVVHGIVVGHGGEITVETRVGEGTTFHIWLPALLTEETTEPIPLEQLVPAGRGRRVFYVDDDEVLILMIPRVLEKCGYEAVGFLDPLAALAQLKRPTEHVDIVVTDLNMPGLSGLDLAREVRLHRPTLPVIVGSGNLPRELVADFEQAGVTATFHKQNALEELPGLIAEVLQTAEVGIRS